MAKNITSLQLLRNTSQLYPTREAAYAALTGTTAPPSGTMDGTPVLARYKGDNDKIYTLVGYYATAEAFAGGTTGETYMTVFDYEGQAGDVEKLREEINSKLGTGITSANTATAQLTALSGNSSSTSAETSVAGAKKYAEDLVKTLDKDASAVAGQVVTTVTQVDGKVTETKANVKDLQLGGYAKTTASGAIASTDTVNVALSKLENNATANKVSNDDHSINVTTADSGTTIAVNIKSGADNQIKLDNNGVYTNLYLSAITPSSTNVKEEYALFNDGTPITTASTSTIKIYKDSSLLSVALLHAEGNLKPTYDKATDTWTDIPSTAQTDTNQALCFAYETADSTIKVEAINVGAFINEQEFASGVTWDSTKNKVRGVVDPTSEKVALTYNSDGTSATTGTVLTVDANGFKVSNIQAAIDAKVNSAISLLDATVTGGTTAGTVTTGHVQVVVGEADGKLTAVTVTETNVADKSKLEELSAKTVTVIESSNNSISATSTAATDGTVKYNIVTDASKIQMSGFTNASVLSAITPASSVTEAFLEVDRVIEENEETIAAALTDLDTRLVDEVAARKAVDGQTGQTYVAHADKKYISGATSLDDADVKLNDAIANITSGWIEGVQVNGVNLPESGNKVNVQITAQEAPTANASGIHVATNSSTGAVTLSLGVINAGEY